MYFERNVNSLIKKKSTDKIEGRLGLCSKTVFELKTLTGLGRDRVILAEVPQTGKWCF